MRTEVYKPEEIKKCLPDIKTRKKKNGKITYYNIPCSFDIETSSFYDYSTMPGGEKRAIMYVWALDLDGKIIVGRTWEEFIKCCEILAKNLKLHAKSRRIIIYIHNFAYEFQFMCKWFEWETVFATDTRRPLYGITTSGIEFRCSYMLSGYKLETVGNNLQKYKVKKLVGQLDYSLIRHTKTELTQKEIEYLVNDVLVVESYIREQIEEYHCVGKIPLTKTGKVRLYCRRECFGRSHKNKVNHYRKEIKQLTLTPEEYILCKSCFQGGFTHANAFYVGKNNYNVKSYDFTSSYPAQMVASRRFPMSSPKHINITSMSQLKYYLKHYACIFEIKFYNLQSKVYFENPISEYHCKIKGQKCLYDDICNNGRVVSASLLGTVCTEIDLEIYSKFYTWDKIEIGDFIYFKRGYLPTEFVKSILDLYRMKTELKGVERKEAEYLNGKEMLNSCFGMAVTDIVREEIFYSEGWGRDKPDIVKQINKYNSNWQRFLYYPWGIYVTALARMALFSGILEFKKDYIYADTDSLKVLNYEKHEKYIKKYNDIITKQLEKACKFHGFKTEMIKPKTVKGDSKPLGVWDDEGIYQVFKTLGAKRYMTLKDHKLEITIAGVGKKQGVEYLIQTYGKYGAFKAFNENLYFPEGHTGKMILTYDDDGAIGSIKDYKGIESDYEEKSFVHMTQGSYDLSLTGRFKDYVMGIQEKEYVK